MGQLPSLLVKIDSCSDVNVPYRQYHQGRVSEEERKGKLITYLLVVNAGLVDATD